MSEYIERETALVAINQFYHDPKVDITLSDIPAADVVEVVRCRECKFYNKPRLGWCAFHMDRENADDFCSYGKRRETAYVN